MNPLEWSIIGWLAVVVFLLDVGALTRAVARAHGVESTLAWMFAILAFPGIGALTYLALANPNVRRTTRRKRAWTAAVRGTSDGLPHGEPSPPDSEGELERGSLGRLVLALTGLPPSPGNAVELLADDAEAFITIEARLCAAREYVWAEYYDVHDDETGRRFLAILAEKAAAGVVVRFLYDGVGSFSLDERRLAALRAAGGHTQVFLPFNPLRRRWALEDWTFAAEESLEVPPLAATSAPGSAQVAVVPSGPDQRTNAISLAYFGAICGAHERVWLSSPYFMPDEPTNRALVAAALRGLDVRILVPARADVPFVVPASRSFYGPLLEVGVRIFEYQSAMMHVKSVAVDGAWGVVGSANIDMRSFRLNFELSTLVHDEAFVASLEESFLVDLGKSVEITRSDVRRRGYGQRLKLGAARLLSPLL